MGSVGCLRQIYNWSSCPSHSDQLPRDHIIELLHCQSHVTGFHSIAWDQSWFGRLGGHVKVLSQDLGLGNDFASAARKTEVHSKTPQVCQVFRV